VKRKRRFAATPGGGESGIDPVHFGIMMVVNMEVGLCHPPMGL
jgi:C4-dicarboxylate transporter DctM subunit